MLALFVGVGVLGFNITQDAVATSTNNSTATAVATEQVKAVTFDKLANLQQYIEKLKKQIVALQAKLKVAEEQSTTDSADWCHTFNTNLRIGDKGAEAQALETALVKQGFAVTEHSSNFSAMFDEKMASSVVGFQEKYKAEILAVYGLTHGTGFVGKTTRAKLNQLYGCGVVSPEPVCKTLWWYDNNTQYCQQKQFCGAYMYLGLRTFTTKAECEADLSEPEEDCRDENYGCTIEEKPCFPGWKRPIPGSMTRFRLPTLLVVTAIRGTETPWRRSSTTSLCRLRVVGTN